MAIYIIEGYDYEHSYPLAYADSADAAIEKAEELMARLIRDQAVVRMQMKPIKNATKRWTINPTDPDYNDYKANLAVIEKELLAGNSWCRFHEMSLSLGINVVKCQYEFDDGDSRTVHRIPFEDANEILDRNQIMDKAIIEEIDCMDYEDR